MAVRNVSRRCLGAAIGLAAAAGAPAAALAGTYDSYNVDLISHLDLDDCSDLNSEGDLVYLGRQTQGVSIIDISDIDNPNVLTTWAHPGEGIQVQDVRALNGDVWISNEAGGTFGAVGLDLTNPAAPTILSELVSPMYPQLVHNMWPYQNRLYLSGYGAGGGNTIVNLTDPTNPVLDAQIEPGIVDIHDVNVVDDVLYIAGGFTATYIYDVTDPTAPARVDSFTTNSSDTLYYSHNAYPIRDTNYLVVTEELQIPVTTFEFQQGSVRVFDISVSPWQQMWRWRSDAAKSDPNISPHNAYVIGDFLYLSAYQDGLKVFDVTDPADPVEVAFFDTFPQVPSGLFEGNWGVDPFQGDDRIFLSDRLNGFFHVAFNGTHKAALAGRVIDGNTMAPIPGAMVRDLTAMRSFTSDGMGELVEKTGAGTHDYMVTAPGYIDLAESVVLPAGVTTPNDFVMFTSPVATDEAPGAITLRLRAARPNPFTPRTTLGFDVPQEMAGDRIAIRVFDTRGRLVATLLDGLAGTGEGAVSWDGRNDAGFRMGSGAYLARMEVGDRVETQKLVLTR